MWILILILTLYLLEQYVWGFLQICCGFASLVESSVLIYTQVALKAFFAVTTIL